MQVDCAFELQGDYGHSRIGLAGRHVDVENAGHRTPVLLAENLALNLGAVADDAYAVDVIF